MWTKLSHKPNCDVAYDVLVALSILVLQSVFKLSACTICPANAVVRLLFARVIHTDREQWTPASIVASAQLDALISFVPAFSWSAHSFL